MPALVRGHAPRRITMVAILSSGTQTYAAPREHRSFRLHGLIIGVIEDVAMGVEAGESGLKSCALGGVSAAALGASAAEINATHHREVSIIEDEDECFDRIGEMLAAGFSHAEVAERVTLGGGSTHMLALERWCDKARLSCNPDVEPPAWEGSRLHERRRRGHRTMSALRQTREGVTHAAVLHIVYGWPDPFVGTLPPEIVVDLGPDLSRLARYTDAVEGRRLDLAHREALRRSSAASGVVRLGGVGGYTDVLAYEKRCLTSGDALRSATTPCRGKREDETKEQYREIVFIPARDARDAFLTAVKLDANRMLTEASAAFRDAWQES